jgi:ribosomal protein S18 acetylase RimI-like enzyme
MREADDMLRELAANRGCRLTKSRRRKPGGDFGRYGLKDAKSGREVFGFGPDGLTANAEEIQSFLRGGAASSWRTSLGKAEKPKPPPKPKARERPSPKARTEPARPKTPPKPAPELKPQPQPMLAIREAKPADADVLAALITALGYEVTSADLRRRLAALAKAGQQALVADKGGVIGVVTTSTTVVIHRPRPVGRISMLVVAEQARGGGVGLALVEEAAAKLKARGCGLLEVTSNIKRLRAHGFYERLGFERTSYRFVRKLAD